MGRRGMTGVGRSGFLRVALASTALCAMALAAGASAAAEAAGGGTTTLGEVVVTAQKREENIQKSPIAITAFTGGQISQAGLAGPEQLQFSVPSMTFGNDDGYSYI